MKAANLLSDSADNAMCTLGWRFICFFSLRLESLFAGGLLMYGRRTLAICAVNRHKLFFTKGDLMSQLFLAFGLYTDGNF